MLTFTRQPKRRTAPKVSKMLPVRAAKVSAHD
jgi:hypothetical protein